MVYGPLGLEMDAAPGYSVGVLYQLVEEDLLEEVRVADGAKCSATNVEICRNCSLTKIEILVKKITIHRVNFFVDFCAMSLFFA